MGDPAAGRELRRAAGSPGGQWRGFTAPKRRWGAATGGREPRRAVARVYRAKATVGSLHGWPGTPAGSGAGARFLRANNGTAIFAGVMAVGRDVPIAPPG